MTKNNEVYNEEFMEIINTPPTLEYVYFENLKGRKIILNEEINENVIEKVIMQIIKFNDEDDKNGVSIENRKPIKLYLSSPGGHVDIGLVLCDVIKASKTPVYGYVFGYAYSMCLLILISCHKKYCYTHTTFLMHDGNFGISGTSTKKAKNTVKFIESMFEKVKQFLANNTKIPIELIEEKFDSSEEFYFWSEDAVSYGVIDEIIR